MTNIPLSYPTIPTDTFLSNCIQFLQHYHSKYPISITKMGLGTSLYVLDSLKLLPSTLYLFHPILFSSPRFELYRGFTNFLFFGNTLIECAFSLLQIGTIQVELEKSLEKKETPHKYAILLKIQKHLASFIPNRFLRVHFVTSICLVAIELCLYSKRGYFIIPYTMFDSMDATLKWIWTLTFANKNVDFGGIRLHPFVITLMYYIMRGSTGWINCIKGFVSALVVCEILNLRNDDGESLVDVVKRFIPSSRNS